MLAFHGNPKIKQKYLDRVIAHGLADEIIKGQLNPSKPFNQWLIFIF